MLQLYSRPFLYVRLCRSYRIFKLKNVFRHKKVFNLNFNWYKAYLINLVDFLKLKLNLAFVLVLNIFLSQLWYLKCSFVLYYHIKLLTNSCTKHLLVLKLTDLMWRVLLVWISGFHFWVLQFFFFDNFSVNIFYFYFIWLYLLLLSFNY